MKLKFLICSALITSTLFSSNIMAASSPLTVSNWVEDNSIAEKYTVVTNVKNNLVGVADKKGNIVIDTLYKDIKIIGNWDKFAVQNKDEKWTITNIGGEKFLKSSYDFIDTSNAENGFIEIGNYGENEFKNKIGILDKNMKLVVPIEYQTYLYKENGELLLGKLNNNKYDYYTLNNDGTLTYKTTLDGILFKKGTSLYIKSYKPCREYNKENNTYSNGYITTLGLVDENYNTIIEPVYENSVFSFNNGLAIVKKDSTQYEKNSVNTKTGNGKYGIIDSNGNEITECKYDSITRIGSSYTLSSKGNKITLTSSELLK